MADNTPYNKIHRSFVVGFSYAPKPEGMEEATESNEPNPEMMQLAMSLTMTQPMLSFVFNTANQEPPTLDQIYACVREGYTATSDNPHLNEVYGLFLDAMKIAKTSPMGFGKTKPRDLPKELEDILPAEIKESLNKVLSGMDALLAAKGQATVFSIENNLVCLKMQRLTTFEVGKLE